MGGTKVLPESSCIFVHTNSISLLYKGNCNQVNPMVKPELKVGQILFGKDGNIQFGAG